jgi:hypothetical protein
MILRNLHRLALIASAAATQLPYNPTRILLSQNGSSAYIFSPQPSSSQFDLVILNTSHTVEASNPALSTIYSRPPFLSDSPSNAFIPLLDDEGDITVLSGDCRSGAAGSELWRFILDGDERNGTWSRLSMSSSDPTLGINFLSAGLSFSPTSSSIDASLYVFGGMCPNTTSSPAAVDSDWTINATYSDDMLLISRASSTLSASYDVSTTGIRGPPIAEAGLTITPLVPITSNTSTGGTSQQQNFVLLGGHTQEAFINMSQVALFSLPESSWSFLNIDQPRTYGKTDLQQRDDSNYIEPRSGHTAILSPDGTKIIVFGGWVGDVSTAADPQLAIVELGQGYGGTGVWSWVVPSVSSSPFTAGQGIYGHGAAMLPGGVMIVSGGYAISDSSSSKSKRQSTTVQQANSQLYLFNTTSLSWISSYTNPSSPNSSAYTSEAVSSSSGALKTASQKAGLGAGLALGLLALAGILIVWFLWSRRLRQKRTPKGKELRKLALSTPITGDMSNLGGCAYSRTETAGHDEFPWAIINQGQPVPDDSRDEDSGRGADRTGVLIDVPSPTRGLRKSFYSKGPTGSSAIGDRPPSVGGGIPRINEADRRSGQSDPFKDPPALQAKQEREREVRGWVEGWSAAAAVLDRGGESRNTPPQSPVKERPVAALGEQDGSLGHAAGRAPVGLLHSVKRVFTGTNNVRVQNRVAEFENRSARNSDTAPEMAEIVGPRRTASAPPNFLMTQRGAKDWDGGVQVSAKLVPGQERPAVEVRSEDHNGDVDWDVEAAVERRVVQVMFTVPKEKLRVVNGDALSLLSKSDINFEGGEN